MKDSVRHGWFAAVFVATAVFLVETGWQPASAAGALDRIRSDGTIRLAYRDDAPPFSYKDPNRTEPAGFMVDLCRAVARRLGDQLNLSGLKVAYVKVTAENRFDTIERGQADLLCEPTSATLSRRQRVDFSIPTFADGASLLTSDMSVRDMRDLAGKKIGVLAGTTTEESLRATLKGVQVEAEVIPAKTHDEGIAMLDSGKITAYFGDRSILMFVLQKSKAPQKLAIAENYFSVEPYALAMSRGDAEFRLAVDTALSRIYRSHEIGRIFNQTFSDSVRPSGYIEALYVLSGLPD